ncbi:DNA/RNA non-specific endonuclease [Altericista sp. CCNU0014]|uniref:DNA/RNA non-specific endonuclease n=1 Tax=Altericista sp. CCNU0014 TaxID=3082949 RepID=UPI00384B9F27
MDIIFRIQRFCVRLRRLLLSFLPIAVLCGSCQSIVQAPPSGSIHLMLGNPSHGTSLAADRYHLFLRPQYALLYDRATNTPAWASWQLNASWLGTLDRPAFTPDPDLPPRWYKVTPRNYTGRGFDRGHIVPAADRNRTPADSAAVFYMTNIAPQAPDNNRGPWEDLESYCRTLARSGKELYIIAGTTGKGGVGTAGAATEIALRQASADATITVPAAFWKIVVVNDRPGLGPSSITLKTRAIAVLIPNQQGIQAERWQTFRTTVRELEQRTGYDFLSNLPSEVQEALETSAR